MSEDPNSPLISGNWFSVPPVVDSQDQSPYVGMLVGTCCGLALIFFRHYIAGAAICCIALAIGVLTIRSVRFAELTKLWFHLISTLVGRVLGMLCLTPLFLIGFTCVRWIAWLAGSDPLQLRYKHKRSFWLPCDRDARKRRFTGYMFATESPTVVRGGSLIPWLACGGVLLVAGEVLLGWLGFGHAVLYTGHPLAGYFPAPHQRVRRLGGVVETNSWGMRAPEFTADKPSGAFRILMLGDSTLYGGQYISNDQLYARLLQENLQRATARPVQVLNMAANGWGPFNELGYVRAFGAFDADLCVICLPVDDFRRAFVPLWETPYFRADAPPRLAYEEILYHLNWRQRMQAARAKKRQDGQARVREVEQGMHCFVELADYLREAGCEVVFEILPSRTAGSRPAKFVPPTERELVDRFRGLLSSTPYDLGFPQGLFLDDTQVGQPYHDEIHLDVGGHALYAEYLAQRVSRTSVWQTRADVASKAGRNP